MVRPVSRACSPLLSLPYGRSGGFGLFLLLLLGLGAVLRCQLSHGTAPKGCYYYG
jgi:hypothetical protein